MRPWRPAAAGGEIALPGVYSLRDVGWQCHPVVDGESHDLIGAQGQ